MVSRRVLLVGLAIPIIAGAAYTRPWEPARTSLALDTGPSRCWFKIEMRLLRTAISETVGDCLEHERINPDNGDTLQRTTGGLMVWRRQDRVTAFTDGARTWALGPRGVETRRNNERFDWEAPPVVPSAVPAESTAPLAPSPPTGTAPAKPIIFTTPTPNQPPRSPPPTPQPAAAPGQAAGDAMKAILDAGIVGSLRASNLPIDNIQALTAETDPEKLLGQPGQYSSKIAFKDSRGRKGDGAVELFSDAAALKARADRLEALGKGNPNAASYFFQSPNAKMLVRVSKDITPEQAKAYEAWMATQR